MQELKVLHQTNPEIPLATRLDEKEEAVAPPSAAEGPHPDGPEPGGGSTPIQVWAAHIGNGVRTTPAGGGCANTGGGGNSLSGFGGRSAGGVVQTS